MFELNQWGMVMAMVIIIVFIVFTIVHHNPHNRHPHNHFRKMGGHDMLDLDEWEMVRDKMLRLHTNVTDSVKG